MAILHDLLSKIWRLITGMSDPSPFPFPVLDSETYRVESLARHDTNKLNKFALAEAYLSRTDGGLHWRITLHFRDKHNSASHYLVADRTQRVEPPAEKPSFSRQASETSQQVLTAYREKDVLDSVRGFSLSPGKDWWECAALNDVLITKLDVTPNNRARLTLLDVALVLHSVSLHRPNYVLAEGNCWWFARCSGLLLELLAAAPQTSEAIVALEKNFFRRAPIPFSAPRMISDDMVRKDVRQIRVSFDNLMVEKAQEEQNEIERRIQAERRVQAAEESVRAAKETARAAEENARAARQEILELKRLLQVPPVTS